MSNLSRRSLLGMLGMASVAGGVVPAAGATAVASKGESISSLARKRIQEQHLPNIPLITHEGKQVRFYDDLVKDKVVSLNFFFAKCDEICPVVTTNLAKVQKLLGNTVGRDLFMYSFTLKPEEDTVAVIKDYATAHGAKPGWTFLTGKPADIELLRRKIGFTNLDPRLDRDKNQHIGNIRYGNEPLMLWGVCPGMAHPQWIAESLGWMVKPDSIRVGSPAAANDH